MVAIAGTGVPRNLCMDIYRLYQRVVCRLKGSTGLSQAFESLCIDKLEEVLLKATHEEETAHPRIGMYVIKLLLYADDKVYFAHTQERMQQSMEILDRFCQESGLTINVP